MNQKYFLFPFATSGDLNEIPNPTQGSGVVSYQQGFGSLYSEDPLTVGTALEIDRAMFNAILYDITTNLQNYQQSGLPEWITSTNNGGTAYTYRIGSMVRYSSSGTAPFIPYLAIADNVTATPVEGANWSQLATYNTVAVETARAEAAELAIKEIGGGFVNAGPGSYNWTVPANVYAVCVEVWGGGGGGGGSSGATSGGRGGGGGGYVWSIIAVTPGQVIPYVVGAGGTGGSGADGNDGGATTFDNLIQGNGGGGGQAGLAGFGAAGGGGGGTIVNSGPLAADAIGGTAGGLSGPIGSLLVYSGQGGGSYGAGSGQNAFYGTSGAAAGLNGLVHGGGGAGGVNGGPGGNGAAGCVRLKYGMC
jgi:hypothetical protein